MVGRGALYTMLSRVAFLASGYAIQFSLAYLLNPREYGTLGVIVSLITLWRVFLSAGLPQTATRFIANDEAQSYGIWRKTLQLQMLAAVGIWVVYTAGTPLWSRVLRDDSLNLDIVISSFLIPFMAWYQINLAYYGGRLEFGRQSVYVALYSVARVVLAVTLAVIGFRIHGAVLGMTLAVLLVAVLTHFGVPKQATDAERIPDWRGLLAFSWPLILVSFGISALLNLDLLLLKRFFPESEIIGFYNGAMNLGKAPYFLLSSFAATVLPSVAKALGSADRQEAQQLVRRHSTYVLLIGLPCAALVVPSAARLLDLVYPERFAQAASSLSILVISMCGLALLSVLTSAMTAAGRPRAAMAVVLGCVPLQCALAFLLIPRFGMLGTAAANLLTVSFGVCASAWAVKREFGGVIQPSRVLKATAISVALGAVFSLWQTYPLIALPALYAAGLALYGGALFVSGALTPGEIRVAKGLLGRVGLRIS